MDNAQHANINNNLEAAHAKKAEAEDKNEEDVIQLIDESEHLFIKYAQ